MIKMKETVMLELWNYLVSQMSSTSIFFMIIIIVFIFSQTFTPLVKKKKKLYVVKVFLKIIRTWIWLLISCQYYSVPMWKLIINNFYFSFIHLMYFKIRMQISHISTINSWNIKRHLAYLFEIRIMLYYSYVCSICSSPAPGFLCDISSKRMKL